MAWHRIGYNWLSEPMLTRFTDAYMQHQWESQTQTQTGFIQHKWVKWLHESFGTRSRYLGHRLAIASHILIRDIITSPCSWCLLLAPGPHIISKKQTKREPLRYFICYTLDVPSYVGTSKIIQHKEFVLPEFIFQLWRKGILWSFSYTLYISNTDGISIYKGYNSGIILSYCQAGP